jgi:hypothetical protein
VGAKRMLEANSGIDRKPKMVEVIAGLAASASRSARPGLGWRYIWRIRTNSTSWAAA